jgi:hypothetical protein
LLGGVWSPSTKELHLMQGCDKQTLG